MLRKLLIGAVVAALVVLAVAAAASGSHRRKQQISTSTTELMPGVTYTREVDFTVAGPVVLDVVTAPKPDGTVYSLAPVLSNDAVAGREKLTAIERRLARGATTVGVDGDYFARSGAPAGIVMTGGVLETAPDAHRSSLGIAADGTLQVAQVGFDGTWQVSAALHPLLLNPVGTSGRFALYTPAFGRTTPRAAKGLEAVFSSFPPARPGQALDGTVTQIVSGGPVRIPRSGAVLVARGSNATTLRKEVSVGKQVELRLTLSPDWSGLTGAIGGGPLLVRNGKAVFPVGEAFSAGTLNGRAARGAVGQLADGRIVLVTVEGANPAYSVGISTYDLALELVQLGAQTAFALGSGPAASMAFDGSLLSRPSAGKEAPVADALVLSYTGVYAAPPAASVLSPNGDGVADTQTFTYRVARPSHVVATLSGPGGARIPLVDEQETPGLHTTVWDGREAGRLATEGSWTFTVAGVDDRHIATNAQRTFSLDDTLGSLTLVRGRRGRATATFQLTRTAEVAVRIERANGTAVATIRSGTLVPGPQVVKWNGRIRHRRPPAGHYRLAVEATSSVGTSSLVAPFTLR